MPSTWERAAEIKYIQSTFSQSNATYNLWHQFIKTAGQEINVLFGIDKTANLKVK